jgi:hypothetical protein
MVKEQGKNLSSFICYNCNEKNYFDKMNYLDRNAREISQEIKAGGNRVNEASIECKSCREINIVAIEY